MTFFFWRYAGPVSLGVMILLVTLYMRRQGIGWRDMGLVPLPGIRAKLMVVPMALLAFVAFAIAVGATAFGLPALGLDFMTELPQGVEDRWGDIRGNLPLYLLWVAIAWISAGFFEEMFFRGYMITRLRAAFAGIPWGALLAVILAALVFGYGHFYYQGWRGLIVTGAIGVAFGSMFLLYRGNLWPMILLHGVVDTLNFTALYGEWE
ncbi:CPBP family intramembrane metalloprotease [Parasphingopyxis sp. GrpM-11]|uniref:CPBP family intramembrane metalloprotease n=2 Tax=Parasphingopyxis marina TaxID=2761622 RepID=A0A842I0U6_9SPHN|nr:CPBP family intramembrane metalloprotease [Parasphingopyxis marina]